MNNRARFVLPCLLLAAAAVAGCHSAPVADPVRAATVPPATVVVPQTPPLAPVVSGQTPIKDALVSLIAERGFPPFPKGTQLTDMSVKDGVATLNFSKEFNALANSGDTTESEAQKALRSALAKFPEVQKMRVTVEGKPFDSQNTDWSTPFPVRDGAPNTGEDRQGGRQ